MCSLRTLIKLCIKLLIRYVVLLNGLIDQALAFLQMKSGQRDHEGETSRVKYKRVKRIPGGRQSGESLRPKTTYFFEL